MTGADDDSAVVGESVDAGPEALDAAAVRVDAMVEELGLSGCLRVLFDLRKQAGAE